MDFREKTILFVSASFFGYERAIIARLKQLGASVDYFDERPSNSVVIKGIIRVNRKFHQRTIAEYYRKISRQITSKNYDYFLLIKGESVPLEFLKEFIRNHPDTERIFYTYDAVAEYPRFQQLFPYFHRNITFEPSDARQYGLEFRPLFFIDEYRLLQKKQPQDLDIVFVGSAHTDRFLIGEKAKKQARHLSLKTFFYYYSPSKFAFRMKQIFDKSFKYFDVKSISFNKLSHEEILDLYSRAKAVLDINKPFQFGLTMRTFEVLASQTKLITTNPEIIKYPFYHADNVLIISRTSPEFPKSFFTVPFARMDEGILSKMTLDSWLEAVFSANQKEFWHCCVQ